MWTFIGNFRVEFGSSIVESSNGLYGSLGHHLETWFLTNVSAVEGPSKHLPVYIINKGKCANVWKDLTR